MAQSTDDLKARIVPAPRTTRPPLEDIAETLCASLHPEADYSISDSMRRIANSFDEYDEDDRQTTVPGAMAGIAAVLRATLISPNVADSNWEPANLVDTTAMIARAIDRLAAAVENVSGQPAHTPAKKTAKPVSEWARRQRQLKEEALES